MVKEKKIVIIAGPNGAGKTTFAKEFLPNEAGCPIFVNDEWQISETDGDREYFLRIVRSQ